MRFDLIVGCWLLVWVFDSHCGVLWFELGWFGWFMSCGWCCLWFALWVSGISCGGYCGSGLGVAYCVAG